MEARKKNSANDCKPKMGKIGRERAFFHQELNQQETEFFMMSKVRTLVLDILKVKGLHG